MNSTLKRKKSIASHAASISAWCAVFDWPSIVAARSVSRHGPESSSAARRNTAARSSHGQRDQSSQAVAAASIACCTCSAPPWWTSARTCALSCGITACFRSPVVTSLPPITSGTSGRSLRICSRRRCSRARSGLDGSKPRIGSLTAGGGRKVACVLMRRTLGGAAHSPPQEVRRRDDDPDHEAEGRCEDALVCEDPVGAALAEADREHGDAAGDPRLAEPAGDLARAPGGERGRDDDGRGARGGEPSDRGLAREDRERLERQECGAAEDDRRGEEAVRVEA